MIDMLALPIVIVAQNYGGLCQSLLLTIVGVNFENPLLCYKLKV
jgi:hypothetical protein